MADNQGEIKRVDMLKAENQLYYIRLKANSILREDIENMGIYFAMQWGIHW